jgi:phenylpropionate dioxygenase-like ring-hydroxylating dioxygenase large terminal subunit
MQQDKLIEDVKTLIDYLDRDTSALADDIMTMSVSEYTDPEQFEREKTELFRNYPQFVGPSCIVPNTGDYFSFDDTGVPILIVRTEDGGLNAFVNICSHRGAPLTLDNSGQAKKSRMFACPYHGWSYDLEGELIGIPYGKLGFEGLDRKQLGLKKLDVQEKDGMIFVMPNPELTFDIDDVLGGIGPYLSGFGFEDSYYLGAKQVHTDFSWKMNMDTFHEYYHFEFLHPESIATMAHGNTCGYKQFGRNHQLSSPSLQIHDETSKPESEWQPREVVSYVNYIFPGTVIFVVNDHFQTWRVYPISPEKSVVYHSMFMQHEPKDDAERKGYEDYFQMINDVAVSEDYGLVDKIHRALKAGIERNVIIGRNEPGVQNMHRQLHDMLG